MKLKLIIAVVGIVAVILISYAALKMNREANLLAKYSAQQALMSEIHFLIEEYKIKEGRYPESITSLPLTYPDSSSPTYLKDITYTATPNSYSLKTVDYRTGETVEFTEKD